MDKQIYTPEERYFQRTKVDDLLDEAVTAVWVNDVVRNIKQGVSLPIISANHIDSPLNYFGPQSNADVKWDVCDTTDILSHMKNLFKNVQSYGLQYPAS